MRGDDVSVERVPGGVPGAAVHPSLGPLAGLIGTWTGEGEGAYPTIAPFRYREEVEFLHDGRPVLGYRQRTWRIDGSAPMHAEAGYLRGPIDGRAELVVAHPTGITEVATLSVHDGDGGLVLEGDRARIGRTPSAKDVVDVRRSLRLVGDHLHYDLWMTYAGHEDTHHLRAVLRRA